MHTSINNGPHVRGRPDERWPPGEASMIINGGSGSGSNSSGRRRPGSSHSSSSKPRPAPVVAVASRPPPPPQLSPAWAWPTSAGPGTASSSAGVVLRGHPQLPPRPLSSQAHHHPKPPAARRSGPLPFPLFFGAAPPTTSNASSSSTSLPSTAEGRSAPLDDGTAALRELNTSFPSNVYRHRYAKSAGAKSTTYSQPVIVRTYTGPSARHSSDSRTSSGSRPVSERKPLPASVAAGLPSSTSASKPGAGVAAKPTSPNGVVNDRWSSNPYTPAKAPFTNGNGNMPRPPPHHPSPAPKKKRGFSLALPWQWGTGSSQDQPADQDAIPQYPPMEAFSMRGIIQAQLDNSELSSDLDRIAELYARSKYSLSNQYDVHVAPHGSGAQFMSPLAQGGGETPASGRRRSSAHRSHRQIGPTLQASWPEDDVDNDSSAGGSVVRSHRKRRSGGGGGGRRKTTAYNTLETIMSSSRSSEEDKTKKKSASELTEAVRGRAERASQRAAEKPPSPTKLDEDGNAPPADSGSPRSNTAPTTIDSSAPSNMAAEPGSRDALGRRRRRSRDQKSSTGSGPPLPTPPPGMVRKKSSSFAHAVTIDSSRQHHTHRRPSARARRDAAAEDAMATPCGSALLLVSEPALPQTYIEATGPLETVEIKAASTRHPHRTHQNTSTKTTEGQQHRVSEDVGGVVPPLHYQATVEDQPLSGLLAGLNGWIPWRGGPTPSDDTASSRPRHAEGSLRDLLKTSEGRVPAKGKGVERAS